MTARGTRGVRMMAVALVAAAFAAAPAFGVTGGADARAESQALAARPGSVHAGPAHVGTGIVQAVKPHAVVVRQLDGRTVRVPVGPRTVVGGAVSSLDAVKPGFIVAFTVRARGAALKLVVVDPSGRTPGPLMHPGQAQSVSATSVVVTDRHEGTLTIAVAPRTRVFLNGSRVGISEIQTGDRLINAVAKASGPRPARVLRFKRPG